MSRIYDTKRWRVESTRYKTRHPWCAICGEGVPSEEVDHVTPISQGGALWDRRNWQALCKSCHSRKTAQESTFGVYRGRPTVYLVVGPPGAGKTTYALDRLGQDDIILDMDLLWQAVTGQPWYYKPRGALPITLGCYQSALEGVRTCHEGVRHAWVITATSDRQRILSMADTLSADIVLMDTDIIECRRRIKGDERRKHNVEEHLRLADAWWHAWGQDNTPIPGQKP